MRIRDRAPKSIERTEQETQSKTLCLIHSHIAMVAIDIIEQKLPCRATNKRHFLFILLLTSYESTSFFSSP